MYFNAYSLVSIAFENVDGNGKIREKKNHPQIRKTDFTLAWGGFCLFSKKS